MLRRSGAGAGSRPGLKSVFQLTRLNGLMPDGGNETGDGVWWWLLGWGHG
ncbi:hypothetical protein HMPREF9062_0426 [Actinomyces sp. oral taxon 448 str. F0400]|nr:hypothetical protein HMPREF9062_0426 [Actinomyces sp. oral taxon 448 str. F0400]